MEFLKEFPQALLKTISGVTISATHGNIPEGIPKQLIEKIIKEFLDEFALKFLEECPMLSLEQVP